MRMLKRLNLENIRNCRDLGGFDLGEGKSTKWQRFIRSGNISEATKNDIKKLHNYGIKHIIDLRTVGDILETPSIFENLDEFMFHNINLLGKERPKINLIPTEHDQSASEVMPKTSSHTKFIEKSEPQVETYEKLIKLYNIYLHNYKGIKEIFDLFLEYPHDGFLFHCGIGKDRTGIVTFFILGLAGVDISDIIADYSLSKTYLRTDLDEKRKFGFSADILNSDADNLIDVYNKFIDEFGSFENYFFKLGYTDEEILAWEKTFISQF